MATGFAALLRGNGDHLDRLGIPPDRVPALAEYLERLWAENQRINLVSRKLEPRGLVIDHLFDCLLALPFLPAAQRIADLGSGGGLPAIPLALCRPETRFTLYEKSPLKCRFLRGLVDLTDNIEVAGPLPDAGLPGSVDLVIARGFKPLATILTMTRAHHRNGGRYLLYKGRRARIDEELEGVRLGGDSVHILRLDPIGEADERHLVCLGWQPDQAGGSVTRS